jgi:hypothetical protein
MDGVPEFISPEYGCVWCAAGEPTAGEYELVQLLTFSKSIITGKFSSILDVW